MEDRTDSNSQSSHDNTIFDDSSIDLVSLTSSDNDDLSPMEELPSQETENDSTNLCQKKRKGEEPSSPTGSKKPCASEPSPRKDSESSGASPELVSGEVESSGSSEEEEEDEQENEDEKTNQEDKKKNGRKQGKGKKQETDESAESTASKVIDHADPFKVISIRLLRCPSGKSGEQAVKSIMDTVNGSSSFEEINLSAKKLRNFEEEQQELIESFQCRQVADFSQEEQYNVLMYRQEVLVDNELERKFAAEPKAQIKHNYLLFYYREEEIFCIAFGTGHIVVQQFSCFDFPERIMKRLCNDDMIRSEKTTDVLDGSQRSYTSGTGKSSQSNLLKVYNYVEKTVQRNCSIYELTAFQPKREGGVQSEIKIGFGYAYLQIKKRFGIKFIPEVLWYFSIIYRGEGTRFKGNLRQEQDSDIFLPLLKIPMQNQKLLDNKLIQLVQDYVCAKKRAEPDILNHQLLRRFRNGTLATWPFADATGCHLVRRKMQDGEWIDEGPDFPEYPPPLWQVMNKVAAHPSLNSANTMGEKDFAKKLKKVQIMYHLPYGKRNRSQSVLKIFQGEMFHEDLGYCLKASGFWSAVSDQTHQLLHGRFLTALHSLLKDSSLDDKQKYWNLNGKRLSQAKVEEYTKLYKEGEISGKMFFVPKPCQTDPDDGPMKSYCLFDMISVEGKTGTAFYSVFPGFDDGIRKKYLDLEEGLEAIKTEMEGNSGDNEKVTLETFYKELVAGNNNVSKMFPTFKAFCQSCFKKIGNMKITIVLMFATVDKKNDRNLQREKALLDTLSWDSKFGLKSAIEDLLLIDKEGKIKEKLAVALGVNLDNEEIGVPDLIAKLNKKMITEGYLTQEGKLSGKLLKMKEASEFKCF